ncbi:MAG: hypothetical protein ABI622_02810 [Chloroflexota bacterium]
MNGTAPRALAWLFGAAVVLAACAPAIADERLPASRAATAVPIARRAVTATRRPSPLPLATPVPTATPIPQPFALNLYQDGDFVPQYTFDWCVAASIQIAHNLLDDTGGGTWADRGHQGELWEMARARSSNSFNGANPFGWAEVLGAVGLGPYAVVSVPDYEEALRTAARAIAETGRPVGLVMWRGRHAWVMSGFESLGDPAAVPNFAVTGIRVQDPLYPHGSGRWGPSPAPNSLLTPAELATQFVVREPRRWSSGLPTGYLLVLPLADD